MDATTSNSSSSSAYYPINYSEVYRNNKNETGKDEIIILPYGYAYAIHLPFMACSHGLIKEDRVFIGPIRLTKKLAYQAVMLEICHYLYTEQILDTNFLSSLKAQGIISQSNHYYNTEDDYYKNNKKEENSFRYLENISYLEKNKKLKLEGNYISDDQRLTHQLERNVSSTFDKNKKERDEFKEYDLIVITGTTNKQERLIKKVS